MKLSVRALAISSGLIWGGCMLTCGLVNLASPSYGKQFLKLMSSVYPGFHNSRTFGDVLSGAGYGLVDGIMGGALAAIMYNQFLDSQERRSLSAAPNLPSQAHAPVAVR